MAETNGEPNKHVEQLTKKVYSIRREHINTVMTYENYIAFLQEKMSGMANRIMELEKEIEESKKTKLTVVGAGGLVS